MMMKRRRTGVVEASAAATAVVLFFVLALRTSTAAAAVTYYVDGENPACSDSGPASAAAPYCSIHEAAKDLGGPGVTIAVRPSVYREQISLSTGGSPSARFVLQAVGPGVVIDGADDFSLASSWTPYVGQVWLAAGVTWDPEQVFVDGARLVASALLPEFLTPNSYRYVDGEGLYVHIGGDSPGHHQVLVGRRNYGFRLSGRPWVTIDGFTVIRSESRGIYVSTGSNHVWIANNRVSHAASAGIRIADCAGVRVARNVTFNNGDHGIYLVIDVTGSVIEGNESFGNARPDERAANGIRVLGSTGNILRNNRTHDNQDTGINLATGGDGNLILQNISWNNGDHGFDTLNSQGNILIGNVAWNNFKDGFSFEGTSPDNRLYDSIGVNNGAGGGFDLWVDTISSSGFASDYNILWNSSSLDPIKYHTTRYATITAFTTATGHDAHSIQADPSFADPAEGDFHPTAGSPAIDSAVTSPAEWPASDMEGSSRLDDPVVGNTGAGPVSYADRGALEFYGDCSAGVESMCGSTDDWDCSLGIARCVDGRLNCSDSVEPVLELCDALDNDCDGLIDESFNLGEACFAGVGECRAAGTVVCAEDSSASFCDGPVGTPTTESCDGLDNDCDGTTDDGFMLGESCTTGMGQCQASGLTVCSANGTGTTCNATSGTPAAESCDGLDNDCDGTADNGFVLGGVCTVGEGQCQASGLTVCSADGAGTTCNATSGTPAAESCDGLDNDCDGTIDNAVPPEGTIVLSAEETTGGTRLSWDAVPEETAYDVVRGGLLTLKATWGDFSAAVISCIANDHSPTWLQDADTPQGDDGFWYLTRPVNCGGAGSYDTGQPSQTGLRDPEIAMSPAMCP